MTLSFSPARTPNYQMHHIERILTDPRTKEYIKVILADEFVGFEIPDLMHQLTLAAKQRENRPSPAFTPQFLDYTGLKVDFDREKLGILCSEAIQAQAYSVCIPNIFCSAAREHLEGSAVKLVTVLDFPLGASHQQVRCQQLEHLVKNIGVDEVDVVIPLNLLFSNDFSAIVSDLRDLRSLAPDIVMKLIIESGLLSPTQTLYACLIAQVCDFNFIKTSTGFLGAGPSVETIQLIQSFIFKTNTEIKASGGIKTTSHADALLKAGAIRIGASAKDLLKGAYTQ